MVRNRLKTGSACRLLLLAASLLAAGCATIPVFIPPAMRHPVDRRVSEFPDEFSLKLCVTNLTCPTGLCFDETGNMIVAEGGIDGRDPRISIFKPDGTRVRVYPVETRIPIVSPGFRMYGPVGGIVVNKGTIYVSHRDAHDMGVITAFTYTGEHKTIMAGLPAQGDFGVTDLAIPPAPVEPRLYFGVGAATNSGVVGLDNWAEGWVRRHRQACDLSYQALDLLGFRFDAINPEASIFSPSSLVTIPFSPFGTSNVARIPAVEFPVQKPSGAIYSCTLDGGDPKIEAWGVRDPEGLAIDSFGQIYLTDRGMELRGTRPVDNDPDGFYQLNGFSGTWLGSPDYSRSLEPINLAEYQPPSWISIPSGYQYVQFIIDHEASKLHAPDKRLLKAKFPWQSGAAKMTLIPESGPFHTPRFEGWMLVALWGDRAPFSTSGRPIPNPLPGYRIVRVNLSGHGEVMDFVYNTNGGPASKLPEGRNEGLERPIDLKFGPDGNLYILDFGRATFKHGHLKADNGTGKIYILEPAAAK